MTTVIACTAQKGGCGKSTTVATMADYLSRKGRKALVIDLNEQGDLSDTLGAQAQTSGAGEVLKGKPIAEEIRKTNLQGIDILTGAENLAMLERGISITGRERALILKNALRTLGRKYDYIVIDAPGSFNTAFLNALAAADRIVIPATADYYNLKGIRRLIDNIKTIKQGINPGLKVDGILLTRYQGRRNLTKDTIEILQGAEKALQTKLFNAKIRENSKIAEAPGRRASVLTYAPGSIGADDYNAFLKEYFNIITGGKEA